MLPEWLYCRNLCRILTSCHYQQMSLSTKKFFPLSSCLLNCYSSGWSNYEFYVLIHDSVKDNDYKNIYRNDLLKFHGLLSISLEQSLLEIVYVGFGYSKEYSF